MSKSVAIPVFYKVNTSRPEGIVHYAIKLTASEIAASLAVCYLIRRIFPDLTDKDSLGILRLHGCAEFIEKIIGKLVCNVKSPSSDTLSHVHCANACLACEVPAAGAVSVIELRKDADTPPGQILILI